MEKLKRAVIKEELLAITGDYKLAITLNQLMYWTERVGIKRYKKFEKEEKQRKISEINDLEGGWIYKKAEELSEETLLNVSGSTIRRYIKKLIKKGYVLERANPNVKFDQTKQYRINLLKIANDMYEKGYVLQGYTFSSLTDSIFQNENRSFQNENSNLKNENAISEITTEITKTEEEDARKIPEKISTKFEQVFNRKMSVELYNKLIKIYSDPQILMKALQISEEQADKPKYLLVILKDWKDKNITSVSEINKYQEERQAKKKKNRRRSSTNTNKKHKELHDIDNLQAKGWN